MNIQTFLAELPALYEGWGTPGASPRSSRFRDVLRTVPGMTTDGILQLLNAAVSFLEPGEAYCEVGCFRGATLIGALLGHPNRPAFAVDNFSEFDPRGQNEPTLRANLVTFGMAAQVRFANTDFEEFLPGLCRAGAVRVGVYLYDGAHDYRSQLLGLLLAVPLLASRALLVVDDANFPAVRQAAWDFMAARPECRLLLDLPTAGNCQPGFWNGVLVLGWEEGTVNGYGPVELRRSRQPALLESLFALQRVNLRVRGDTVSMAPIE